MDCALRPMRCGAMVLVSALLQLGFVHGSLRHSSPRMMNDAFSRSADATIAVAASAAASIMDGSAAMTVESDSTRALADAHEHGLRTFCEALSLVADADQKHAAGFGVDAINRGDLRGTVQGFEGPPASGVSWACGLLVTTCGEEICSVDECPSGTCWTSSFSVWNAPTDDVPHLHASVAVVSAGVELCLDFVPRAEGGYDEQAEASGGGTSAYPPPDSREAFAMAGVRKDYDERFFTDEMRRWRKSALASIFGHDGEPLRSSSRRPRSSAAGPLYLDVLIPHGTGALERALRLRQEAVARWLSWKASAQQLDHVGTTRVYKRDCALRAHSAALAEQVYCERFGVIFGQSLAAAEAGPEDMTKHSQLGQGSGGGLV